MHKIVITIWLSISAIAFATAVQAGGYNVNPGMWETTYEVKISGASPEITAMMQQPPKTERKCITDEMINFSPADMGKECSFTTTRHGANKASWEIRCSSDNNVSTGYGEANFNGNTVSGRFEMQMQAGPMGPIKMRNVFKSKRLGPC